MTDGRPLKEASVKPWLALSGAIDAITDRIGRFVYWLILLVVVISAANAVVRKAFNYSSNSYLEIQWYLFSAIFLLGAGYTLMRNEHIRIDVVVGRLSARKHAWIDIFGTLFFLLPLCGVVLYDAIPYALLSLRSGEVSTNAGGLIIWPAKILIPIGFALLALQGVSEIIKRIAFLRGLIPDPAHHPTDAR